MDRDEITPITDFSGDAFIQIRDPMTEMIDTFSGLYIDSEEEKEKSAVQVLFPGQPGDPDDFTPLPPPPPLDFDEEQVYSNGMATTQRLTNIEEHLSDIEHRVSDFVIQDTVLDMMKQLEDKILDDSVVFVERVEEYFNLRPLSDKELMASLSVALKGTAKDWWRAERKNIDAWKTFKEKFLFAFLNEDFKEVAAQRLVNRRQQNRESIRDFAYHYRALCMRNKPDMTEEEIVRAILRNRNPRLASLLRSSAKNVDELVRLGTQIEKDWMGAKHHWSLVNTEEQNRKSPAVSKRTQENQLMLMDHPNAEKGYQNLQLPVTIKHTSINAIIDTGSTFSLVQYKIWKKLKKRRWSVYYK